jgi:hypothetical protein
MGRGLEGFDADVLCLAIHDSRLVAGGGFTRSGETDVRGVAV